MDMVRKNEKLPPLAAAPPQMYEMLGRVPNRPTDLPIYSKDFMRTEPMQAPNA